MNSREWTRWKAFYKIRPFGEAGADLRAGVVAAAMVNCMSRYPKAPIDFMPVIKALEKARPAAAQQTTGEQLKEKFRAFFGRGK